MSKYSKVIFIARSGICREIMAQQIMLDMIPEGAYEVEAKGLVVQFPEPMNQKAEAVLISNGINVSGQVSKQLTLEDVQSDALLLTMESSHRDRLLEMFGDKADPSRVFVLSEFVGDELEILDPYGGNLVNYGLCFESLKASIKKLIKILDKGDNEDE